MTRFFLWLEQKLLYWKYRHCKTYKPGDVVMEYRSTYALKCKITRMITGIKYETEVIEEVGGYGIWYPGEWHYLVLTETNHSLYIEKTKEQLVIEKIQYLEKQFKDKQERKKHVIHP